MADTYPKVSERAWRTLRAKAAAAPSTRFTPTVVATTLGMASAASALSNVVGPMRRLGLFDDDGSLTARGQKWRSDATYREACDEIIKEIYPDDLSAFMAADGSPDIGQIRSWFSHNGFGNSNAGNMATTYAFIASRKLPEAPDGSSRKSADRKGVLEKKTPAPKQGKRDEGDQGRHSEGGVGRGGHGPVPNVHLDIQIHIPGDATPDQIEAIFASMGRHIYGRSE